MRLSIGEARDLIALARDSILAEFEHREDYLTLSLKKKYAEKQGIFVTLHKHGELRGCIGFPEPILPLFDATIQAAQSASFSDPRFPPLKRAELKDIIIEISVLTQPELITVDTPLDYLKHITIGKDGLIIRSPHGSGLLLPQVAAEWHWKETQFLENICYKAGLSPSYWLEKECKIYKFQAQIFREENGQVIEVKE
jgi:uncharacterized protein (TIGR00296 family)